MSDDLLSLATRALKEEAEIGAPPAEFTRARVLATLRQKQRKKRLRHAYLISFAAVLACSTALAAVRGDLPRLWEKAKTITEVIISPKRTEPKKAASPSKKKLQANPINSAEPAPEAALSPVPPPELPSPPSPSVEPTPEPSPTPRILPTRKFGSSTKGLNAGSSGGALSEEDSAETQLFRAAHSAHFVAQNPALALSKWDAYLAQAKGGRFVPEARYNRAICLVRLNRADEARAALKPFATRAYGAYRCREARDLLEELGEHKEYENSCD